MKKQKHGILFLAIVLVVVMSGCTIIQEWGLFDPIQTVQVTPVVETVILEVYNPASKNCEQNGYQSEIRTAGDGSQYGVCIFPDGTECEEWAYLRGDCSPTPVPPVVENKASEAARIRLAEELSIDTSEIELISLEKVIWQDTCLAIPMEGETCWTVVTPGFQVVFLVGERTYVYNTDLTGENIRQDVHGSSFP